MISGKYTSKNSDNLYQCKVLSSGEVALYKLGTLNFAKKPSYSNYCGTRSIEWCNANLVAVPAKRRSNRIISEPRLLRDMEHPAVLGYELDRNTLTPIRQTVKITSGDYGADPIGDGKFRMVPSGDIVDFTERQSRLRKS